MGIKADGIEVSIESSASKAIAELDKLIAKLDQVSNSTRAISTSNNNKTLISSKNAMSGMGKKFTQEIEKAQKGTLALQKVISDFSNVGKGARFDGTYSQLEKEITKVTTRLDTLGAREEKMKALGRDNPSSTMWKDLQYEISKSLNTLIAYQEQLSNMSVSSNSAFSWQGVPYDSFEDFWEAKNKFVEASDEIEESIESVQQKMSESVNGKTPFSENAVEKAKAFEKNISKAIIPTAKLSERLRALSASADKALVGMGVKRYSEGYENLQKEIDVSKRKIETLNAQIEKGRATNNKFSSSVSLKKYQYEIDKTKDKVLELENAQDRLQMSGKSTKWNVGQKYEAFMGAVTRVRGGIGKIDAVVSRTAKLFGKLSRKILSIIFPFNTARKSMDKFGNSSSRVSKSMGMMLRAIKMMIVYKAFRATINGIKTGMENLAQYSAETNSSLSMLMNSMNQLKNATASAAAPLLNAFAPAINSIIQICIKATNAVNQLFAALTGQNTWIKATALTEDYANKIKSATKEAEKHKRSIMSYDELNIASDNSNSGSSGTSPSDMFDTVQIESKYKELADKIKDIANKLFAPIKQAWEEVGEFVMDSWKFALERVWSLIKVIGADFLKVWQQQATVDIFKDILAIIGDIGLAVGHLAENFEKAWSANDVGLRILENIRDVIGIIVKNIKHAADTTVEWSKNLNFAPLLGAFERFTSSLKPAIDALSGILTDFYEKVLLPLGKWTIEKGLPQLLDVFTAFNEKVDWDALRKRLSQFWEHLEPFAETVGEGLVIFIERVSDLVADFVNSDKFDGFLDGLEKWMDNIEPDDVADAIENLVKALFALKGALVALDGIIKASAIGGAIAGWAPHIAVGAGIVGVVKSIKEEVSDRRDTSEWNLFDWISETLSMSADGWMSELENFKISLELWWQDTWLADKIWNFEKWWGEKVSPWFTAEKWGELWEGIKDSFATKWGEIVAWWESSALSKWWNEHVSPYFEETDWTNLFSVIKSALQAVWGMVIEWWDNSALGAWWNEHVTPYFEETDWADLFSVINSALQMVWGELVKWWESSTLGKWWSENVAPYFEDTDWKDLFSVIESALRAAWGLLVQWWEASALYKWYEKNVKPWFTNDKWNFEGIKKGLGMAFDAAVDAVKQIWNKFANWLNSKLKLTIPPIRVLGITLFGGTTLDLGKIPTFQTGGFPEDGLFMANHGELLGKFSNGKTAVANNEQIIEGVSQGVRSAVVDGMMQVFMATSGDTGNQNSDRPIQIILDGRIIAESTYAEFEDMAARGLMPGIV